MIRILVAALLLLATPALADNCSTQSPPSPASNMAPASPCNSLPRGEATARYPTFGGDLGVTRVGPPVGGKPLPPMADRAHAPRLATPGSQPVLAGSE